MSIKRRKIFYISGFDPRGPNYYHTLYRDEAETFAQLTGENINILNRKHASPIETTWKIERTIDGQSVKIDFSFLRWDDIVRENWEKAAWPLFTKSFKTYAHIARNFDWKLAFSLNRTPLITLIYPILLAFILLSGIMKGWDMVAAISSWWIIQIPALIGLFWAASKLFSTLKAPWLLRLFIANHSIVENDLPTLNTRTQEFAALIKAQIDAGTYDEILLIAHSNGTALLTPLIAALADIKANMSALRIVSLGHCIPLVTLNTKATAYLATMKAAAVQNIKWLDIGAPADGTCYALIGPYKAASGLDQSTIKNDITTISPRFHTLYEEEHYKKLRWNKYAYHFLYLTCPDTQPQNSYSYFELTSGALSCDEYAAMLQDNKS